MKKIVLTTLLTLTALTGNALADKVLTGAFDQGPGGAPQQFNPLTATAGFTWLNKYYSTLVLYDVNFKKISGDLASSWTVADNGTKYTFVLRPNLKWSDGSALTSKDVKFSMDLANNPDSGSGFAAKFSNVTKIETPNARTVVITLGKPNGALLDALTSFMILPSAQLSKIAPKELRSSAYWRTNPVGSGPFMWSKYVPDQYVELKANPNYYKGRPKLDRLVNRYFKEQAAAVLALKNGDIDFSYLTLDDTKTFQNATNVRVISGPSQVANYLGFNNASPMFKDVRVRQAMLHAIDRATIMKQLYGGGAEIANCPLTNDKYEVRGLNTYAYDPAKAKKLLQDAKWNSGTHVEIMTYYSDQLSKDVLVTIQQMLAQVGMKVTPRFVDVPTYNQITSGTDFQLLYAGIGNGPDPDTLFPTMHSDFFPPKGTNRTRVNIADINKALENGQETTSAAKRTAAYQNLCKVANAQLPWDMLWTAKRFGGANKDLVNFVWTPAPGGGRYQDNAELWDVK